MRKSVALVVAKEHARPARGRSGSVCPSRRGVKIPIVQKIRHDCAEPFAAFEQCLKLNQTSVVNCTEHVQQFLLCAEKVKLAT
ncbi:hypothetical protein JD844_010641 [Phrynosoma platyrhinos]|uniref:Coiled-coil-helix-coiled-coil-helix domain-containing protein 5 n=1 Tax=Phrynosoma platyrhinos TaxID=52577 RepID=A0ABQ7TGS8_PHRPL|nr:hypothetical protein JD844_010641 [Phrynosoma platyrhinos]